MTAEQSDSIHGRRVRKGRGFESLRREMLQDIQISFKAQGILTYLLSLPDTWKTNSERLGAARPGKEGRDAIRSGLRELEAAGYLRRDRRLVNGRWQWEWQYTDDPSSLIMDGLSGDGSPVDIEIQDHRGSTRDGERSTQNEADASSSTSPLTVEDQNIDSLRYPPPRERGVGRVLCKIAMSGRTSSPTRTRAPSKAGSRSVAAACLN
jgi:hypothetical protein